MAIAALNSQITTNLGASNIADQAAPYEADRTSGDGSRDGSYGRVRESFLRSGSDRREDNSDSDEGKSTKRPHGGHPCDIGDSPSSSGHLAEFRTPAPTN